MNYKVQNLTKQQITTSLLPNEFYSTFDYCQQRKDKMDAETLQKIDFIAKKLIIHFAEDKKKSFLAFLSSEKKFLEEEMEYPFFQSISKELLIKIYIETVKSYFPDSNLYFPNMIKKGVLYVRSQTLKIWNERVLELNYNDKILSISKIAQKNKGDKNLDLNTYMIKWVGKIKGRFCFRLDSLSSKNKYKNFRIASEFLENAIEWHENIKATVLPELNVKTFEELKNKYTNIYSGKEKEEVIAFAEDTESPPRSNKKSNWTSIFTKKSTKNKEAEKAELKKSSTLFDAKLDQKSEIRLPQTNTSTGITQIKENQQDNLVKSAIVRFDTSKKNDEPNENEEKKKNVQEKIKDDTSKELNMKKEISYASSNLSLSNEEEEQKDSQELELKGLEEIPTNNKSKNSFKQENIFAILNRKTSCPNIVQDILCNIDKEDLISELDYNLLLNTGNFRIMQHNHEYNRYKIFLKLTNPWRDVLTSFMDPLKYKLLNSEIAELKILSMIQYNKSAIIYEKRKPYGRLYLPREFVYMRYMYESKDSFIIVDRSIDYNDIPHSYFSPTIRGSIISNAIYISKNEENHSTSIYFSMQITNNGVVSSSQDHEINFVYLQQFKQIENKISKGPIEIPPPVSPIQEHKLKEIFYEVPLAEEAIIRKKTKVLNALDIENKDKIIAGLLLNEENENKLAINKKRSTSMDDSLAKGESHDYIEENFKEVDCITEIQHRNREVSFACQKTAEILSNMLEENLHIMKCISNKHNMDCREVKMPRFQQWSEIDGHYVLRRSDWVSNKSGGFIYHNQKILDVQKKILGYLLKRMGTNLIQGKSIMSISLPIELFDKKSHLEILANNFTFAPHFLNKANESNIVLEQMKLTISFFLTTLHMATAQLKPFNPILGETFQARINGMPIYLEQTSHHPPISSLILYGPGYKMLGYYEAHASLHANSCAVSILGSPQVTYQNGSVFYTSIPFANISGTSFGQRTFNYEGKAYCYEPNHLLACELSFNPDKKGLVGGLFSKQHSPSDYFSGAIYQVNKNCIANMQKIKYLNKFEGINLKEDVVKEICKVSGIWHKYFEFDGVKYWEYGKSDAYELEYERNPLPSDSIYREDIISWKGEDLQKSQMIKEKIENIQRNDRKLREKLGKNQKKGHH